MLLPPPPALLWGGNAAGEQTPAQAVTASLGCRARRGSPRFWKHQVFLQAQVNVPLEQCQGAWDAPSVCHKRWMKRMQTATSLILECDGKSSQHEPGRRRKSVPGKVCSASWLGLSREDGRNMREMWEKYGRNTGWEKYEE